MKENKNNKKILWIIIILVVFAIILSMTAGNDGEDDVKVEVNKNSDNNVSNIIENETTQANLNDGDVSVVVMDQASGQEVLVSEVSVPNVSWVAVREQRDGQLWSILGARRVNAGVTENITVPLLRGTESQNMYYVVIYQDDGDGVFDHTADTLVSVEGDFYKKPFNTL